MQYTTFSFLHERLFFPLLRSTTREGLWVSTFWHNPNGPSDTPLSVVHHVFRYPLLRLVDKHLFLGPHSVVVPDAPCSTGSLSENVLTGPVRKVHMVHRCSPSFLSLRTWISALTLTGRSWVWSSHIWGSRKGRKRGKPLTYTTITSSPEFFLRHKRWLSSLLNLLLDSYILHYHINIGLDHFSKYPQYTVYL